MSRFLLKVLYFVVILGSMTNVSNCAVAGQLHHKRSPSPHREREEDGAFSPRDKHHFENEVHETDFDHESILGSKKEAEEFDSLPPEVAKERLKELAKMMDKNNDNVVDRTELKQWIIKSFNKLSKEESKDRFEDTDENEDGEVSWKEYMDETYGMENDDDENPKFTDDEEERMFREDKELFQAADANKDGRLDENEFFTFTHPEEDPKAVPLVLEQMLTRRDKNKDGFIDFQEFIAEAGDGKDNQWMIAEREKFDNDYDKDGDGKLNNQEIIEWMIPSNDDIADDEVSHLFSTADEDADGLLTMDEIVGNHETFVGSEATDYGEHLHDLDRFKDEL